MSEAGYQRQLLHTAIGVALREIKEKVEQVNKNLGDLLEAHAEDYDQSLGYHVTIQELRAGVEQAESLDTLLQSLAKSLHRSSP